MKGTIGKKEMEEIESSQFAAKAVEPHGTQSGFLFFDVAGISSPLPGANIDITGVRRCEGERTDVFRNSSGQIFERAAESVALHASRLSFNSRLYNLSSMATSAETSVAAHPQV